jgi:starch phosphorylase
MTDTRNSVRLGNSPAELKKSILNKLYYIQGRLPELATPTDWYMALAYAVRDRMMNDWIRFVQLVRDTNTKIVAYLSAEFLLGRHLENNLINLGIRKPVQQAVADLGLDFDEILQEEAEPGLGSGGLGRLAACYTWTRLPLCKCPRSATASAMSSDCSSRKSGMVGR